MPLFMPDSSNNVSKGVGVDATVSRFGMGVVSTRMFFGMPTVSVGMPGSRKPN
jgi:peroxiredoxin